MGPKSGCHSACIYVPFNFTEILYKGPNARKLWMKFVLQRVLPILHFTYVSSGDIFINLFDNMDPFV